MKCLSKMIIHNCCSSLDYFLILMMAQNLEDFRIAIISNDGKLYLQYISGMQLIQDQTF